MGRIAAGQDFGRTSVEPARTAVADISPGIGAVADAVNRIGAQQAAEGMQAQRIAAAEADQARKQAEHEAKVARDMADRAVSNAAIGLMRDGLADELKRIGQEVQDGTLPKTDAIKAWQDRSAKLITDNIGAVPEVYRSAVSVEIQGRARQLDSGVSDIVRSRDQHDTLAAIQQTREYTQRLAVTDPEKARLILTETLDKVGPFAGLAPDQIAREKQAWSEGVAYTRAFTAVNAAKTDNKALSAVEQAISANGDLDPQKKAQLLAHVDTYRAANDARALQAAQRAEIAAARAQRQSDEAFTVLSGWALAGKMANPDANAALLGRLTPTAAAAYREMVKDIPARTAAAMLPLNTQAQQLDQLRAQAVQGGTSQELEREIKRREQVLSEARKDYAADPLRAGNERGILPSPLRPLDTSSLDTMAAGLVERATQAQAVATRTGQAVSPLLSEEATRMGGLLNALPVADRGRRIAQIAEVLPTGMMLALSKQVDAKDKPLALAMAAGAARTTEGRTTAELILRGAQAVKDKSIKEDQGAEIGLRSQVAKEVGDAVPESAREDVIAAARLVYLGKAAEGNTISIKGAVRLAVGGDIVEHNGRRIPLPVGLSADVLADKLRQYPARAIQAQAPDATVYVAGGRPMGVPEFLARLPDAQLEPVAAGRYVVRTGTTLAVNAQRQPIVIEVNP